MRDPVALANAQTDLTRRHAELWQNLLNPGEGAGTPKPRDRRFRNEEWEKNLALRALMHSYLIGVGWLRSLVEKGDLEASDRKKVTFFTEQFIDASSPTNFAFIPTSSRKPSRPEAPTTPSRRPVGCGVMKSCG